MQLVIEAIVDDDSTEADGDGRWPFGYFVELLILDMFDSGKCFAGKPTLLFWEFGRFFWMASLQCLILSLGQFGRFAMAALWH